MPRRPPELQGRAPRDFAIGDTWPDGPWVQGTPDVILYIAHIVRAMRDGFEQRGWSMAEAAAELGVARQTAHDILTGRTYPDLVSIVRAEQVLGVRLWPHGSADLS